MKILYSGPSPYGAKVRMAAAYTGIACESVSVATYDKPEQLISANPLGKIPTLVMEDGSALFDSRAIMQFIDRESGKKLFPRSAPKRTEAERMEALADGICDCLLAQIYEQRFRPAEKIEQSWLDLQEEKVTRAFDYLCAERISLPSKIHGGHIALRAMIGYRELRFGAKWSRAHSKLPSWAKRFDAKFPELATLIPHN